MHSAPPAAARRRPACPWRMAWPQGAPLGKVRLGGAAPRPPSRAPGSVPSLGWGPGPCGGGAALQRAGGETPRPPLPQETRARRTAPGRAAPRRGAAALAAVQETPSGACPVVLSAGGQGWGPPEPGVPPLSPASPGCCRKESRKDHDVRPAPEPKKLDESPASVSTLPVGGGRPPWGGGSLLLGGVPGVLSPPVTRCPPRCLPASSSAMPASTRRCQWTVRMTARTRRAPNESLAPPPVPPGEPKQTCPQQAQINPETQRLRRPFLNFLPQEKTQTTHKKKRACKVQKRGKHKKKRTPRSVRAAAASAGPRSLRGPRRAELSTRSLR